MDRTAVLNVVGLSGRFIGEDTPFIRRFTEGNRLVRIRPQLPAVTCTMQATFLTGKRPDGHGIVANGWYDRELAEHQFWKQSNHLVKGPKLWEVLRERRPGFTCAKLFWWYNMYSSADWSITPRPMYPADGRKVFDIYTHPMGDRERVKEALGPFPFASFWGPASGLASSHWIAQSARWIEDAYAPDLSLVYLPHLDYGMQKLGPEAEGIPRELRGVDALVEDLVTYLESKGVRVILLSEYGITPVSRPVHLNRVFRRRGWSGIKMELGREQLDLGASRAFAMADHQIAHIYVKEVKDLAEVKAVCEETPGVERVLDNEGKREFGLDHARSGDLVAIAGSDSWFTYYYWKDDRLAPDYARCVDIHRKPGYDPVELFLDPALRWPKLKVGRKLLRKKLGFRMLMDVIPLDAALVRGSHGSIPADRLDWPILAGAFEEALPGEMDATEVFPVLLRQLSPGHGAQK